MSRNQSSRRGRRSLITWTVIVVSAGIALVFGVFGFAEYYASRADESANPSFVAILYDSVRLLLVEWDASTDETLPKALRYARLFALVSWSAAAIKGLLTFARKQVELARCRLYRNHAIVCGLGRQGFQLVSDLATEEIRVIVIELDADNAQIPNVRAQGVPVLIGNAASASMMRDAAAKRARFVFAVAGEDKVNIEIATKAFESRGAHNNDGRTQRCAVHIDNAEISTLFAERPLFKTRTADFDAHFFNINRLAARIVLDRYPPDRFQKVHGADDAPASIMVFGTEMLAHEMVIQVARVGHYGNRKKPIVQLVTGAGSPVAKSVEKRSAVLRDFIDLEIKDAIDLESLLTNDDLLEEMVSQHEPSIVYICLSSAVSSLRLVAGLQRLGATERAKVVVCTAHRSDFTLLAPSAEEQDDSSFALFDVMREACTVENIMRERLDDLARAIHDDYVARQNELGYTVETNSTLVDWRALPQGFREANRHQADYLAVKLRLLGYNPPSKVPPKDLKLTDGQLELVAELEHRRWLAAKRLAGWRYTAGLKDATKRIAPTIAGWDALTEEEKEKDRDTARDLPRLLKMKLAINNEQT